MKYGCVSCDWKGEVSQTVQNEKSYAACPECGAEAQPMFDNGRTLKCGQCGNAKFFQFGPYEDDQKLSPITRPLEEGLHMIYTCTECGNQVREFRDGRVIDCHTKEERKSKLMAMPVRWKLQI